MLLENLSNESARGKDPDAALSEDWTPPSTFGENLFNNTPMSPRRVGPIPQFRLEERGFDVRHLPNMSPEKFLAGLQHWPTRFSSGVLIEWAEKIVEKTRKPTGESLFLVGPPRSGKTYVMTYLLYRMFREGYEFRAVTSEKLAALAKTESDGQLAVVEDDIRATRLLGIDGLGEERIHPNFQFPLLVENILRHRWGKGTSTILTSHLSLKQIKAQYGEGLVRQIEYNMTEVQFPLIPAGQAAAQ